MKSMKYLSFSLCLALSLTLNGMPAHAQNPQADASQLSETSLRQALERFPNQAEAHIRLADYLIVQLRIDWARRDPSAAGASFQAQAEDLQRRAQELVFLYERALKQAPERVEAKVHLAEVYFVFLNHFQRAEELLQEALAEQPDHPSVNIAMAEYQFFFKGQQAEALQRLEQTLQKHPQHPGLIIAYVDLKTSVSDKPEDYLAAREQVSQALAQQPADQNLQHMLGLLWLREADLSDKLDLEKAERGLNLYIALFEAHGDPAQALEAAQIARDMGRLAQARELVRQGLKQAPEHARLTMLLGDLWLKQAATDLEQGRVSQETADAETQYQWLVAQNKVSELLQSEQVQLYYNLGLLAVLQGKTASNAQNAKAHFENALNHYRQAQAMFDRLNLVNAPLQTDIAKTLEALGALLAQEQKMQAASEKYREACSLKLESSCQWLQQQGFGR